MPFDVFISYSSKDSKVADAVCHFMEAAGIRVWMASRNIQPGDEWSESIVAAIKDTKILVLIFSSHSNDSPQVKREVEIAVGRGMAIIPFRIQDIVPSGSMEYFIGPHHWLDAMTPPLERHFKVLTEKIQALLQKESESGEGRDPQDEAEAGGPQDLIMAEAAALTERWATSGYPYYLVESLSQELKAMVRNPPFDVEIDDAQVRSFLLLSSLHYGGSWAFWAERNADNVEAVQQVIKVLGLTYERPKFRAICALQFFPVEQVKRAAADLGGALDPRIQKKLEKVIVAGYAREYLQKIIDGPDAASAKKAAEVLRELTRAEESDDENL